MIKLSKLAWHIEKRTFPYLKAIGGLSSIILILMMMVTVADAVGRRLFGMPLPGAYEVVSFLLCILFFGSMCSCSLEKNHLSISVLTSIMPKKVRMVIVSVGRFVSFLVCWLMAWRLAASSLNEKRIGTHGMQLTSVPLYPFILIMALGMLIIGFVFLLESFQFNEPENEL